MGINAEDDQDENERRCDAAKVILGGPAVGRAERVVNSQDQIDTQAEIEHQRNQLEKTVEDLVALAQPVSQFLLLVLSIHVLEHCVS